MTPADLVELELIKQLKARYFRLMDQKRWEEFAQLFTEDCENLWQASADAPAEGARGREGVVAFIRDSLEGLRSTHHGHMPEIELTSATTAVATWALFDHCARPDGEVVFHGAGYYRDEYAKEGGRWRIRKTHLRAGSF